MLPLLMPTSEAVAVKAGSAVGTPFTRVKVLGVIWVVVLASIPAT